MKAFNAILVGALGGVLLVLIWNLAARFGGFDPGPEELATVLFLVGWWGSAILILFRA